MIRRVGRRDFGTCRAACQWPVSHDGTMRGTRGGVDCRPQHMRTWDEGDADLADETCCL